MIIESLSFQAYQELPGISMSKLRGMGVSPAHFKYEGDHKDSPEKKLGRLVDCLITTPGLFPTSYYTCEVAKKGSAKYNEQLLMAEGKELIDPEDLEIATSIKDSFFAHSLCQGLMRNARTQLSVTWETSDGVACKGRPDLLSSDLGILVDIKTTKDARPESFQRSAEDYCYFHQLEFYRRGLIANGEKVGPCIIVALETKPPYKGVQVYELAECDLEAAGTEIDGWLKKYKYCIDTNEYPCYPELIHKLYRPAWKKK